MRWIAVGLVCLIASACSPSSSSLPTAESVPQSSPLVTLAPARVCTATWLPAVPISTEAATCLDQYGATTLLPVTASDDSQATVNVFEAIPRGTVFVGLSVTTVGDDRQFLSINAYPSDSDYMVACDRRIAAEDRGEGSPTWNAVQIRGNRGCSATSEAGLTFIEWIEAELWLHVETYVPHDDAVAWLTSWELSR